MKNKRKSRVGMLISDEHIASGQSSRSKNQFSITSPKAKNSPHGGDNEDIHSQITEDWIKIKAPTTILKTPQKPVNKNTKHLKYDGSVKRRKEIKISLVEGMIYDDSGKI